MIGRVVALALVLAAAPAAAGEREVTIPLALPGLFGPRTVTLSATEYRPDGDGPSGYGFLETMRAEILATVAGRQDPPDSARPAPVG